MQILNTGLRVRDIQRSLTFYVDALGLKEVNRIELEGHSTRVYLSADPEAKGTCIELIQFHDVQDTYDVGTGLSHVAVHVDNLEAMYQILTHPPAHLKGLYSVDGAPRAVLGNRFFYAVDPDGYRVALAQYPEPPPVERRRGLDRRSQRDRRAGEPKPSPFADRRSASERRETDRRKPVVIE